MKYACLVIALLFVPLGSIAQETRLDSVVGTKLHRMSVGSAQELQELFQPTAKRLSFVSAHRGGAQQGFPENCLATFEKTLQSTRAIMEVDPRYTKDGAIVLHHDATLDRTTTGTGRVADFTLAQLKQLRLKDNEGTVTDFQIPTLEEAFEWARGRTILVLDQKDMSAVERTRKITEHSAEAHVMLIVNSFKDAQACYALNPNVMMEVMIPTRDKAEEFDKLGIPWRNVVAFVGHTPPEDPALYEFIHSKGASCMIGTSRNLDRSWITGKIAEIQKLEPDYRAFLERGADIIETDIPSQLGPMLFREVSDASRPRLQIINGTSQPIDVFWLKTDTERVPNGSVAPGKNTIITTTLGHRFLIVAHDAKETTTVTSEVLVQAIRFEPPSKTGVPLFYTQTINANGYPIVASAKVSYYAIQEAAYLVNRMLAKRPDVRDAMIKSGSRLCILAHNEFTTDQPEFANLQKVLGFEAISASEYWDARARGLGGSATDPLCSCAEENLLAYDGDPYATENILIHEFAHNIHLRGMANVDPTFDTRLKSTFDTAIEAGLWNGAYASTNHHEYFAEGVQSWFDNNRENDAQHNHVNTRDELLLYDPRLAALCSEVFGDTVLKYTKPQTRLIDHLEGYDPSKSPSFVWPDRLTKARGIIKLNQLERFQSAK